MTLEIFPGKAAQQTERVGINRGERDGTAVEIAPLDWQRLADGVLAGVPISKAEALAIVQSTPDQLLAILDASFKI
ncbi:MAG: hypothetical protein ACPGQS_02790, partial [Bradymonadia bacterium]